MMRTELKKPTRMPLQVSPVQAANQALIQAAKVGALGRPRMLPWRISGMRLQRRDDHHVERHQEEQRRDDQEGIEAEARRRQLPRAAAAAVPGVGARSSRSCVRRLAVLPVEPAARAPRPR